MPSLAQILQLDPGDSLPLYQQLERALRRAIEQRVLGPDDVLPPERQLAADLEVSRITVRKAIDLLAAEGYLVKRQGAGNFVSARIDKNFAKLTSFSEDMISRGRVPRSVWLKRAAGTVSPEESLKLALSPGRCDRESAMFLSGSLPMSSAVITSTTESALRLTSRDFSTEARTPVTKMVSAGAA